ncbi:MAG TPA: hypothetical protein VEI94_09330 [Candidatus Bathyarchaeia archaeon]|nr:hypothetical protein [Candidatus Bathyarchaeia archaeon]
MIRVQRQAGRPRTAAAAIVLASMMLCASRPTAALAQSTISTPLASGDQLIFFYDARTGRTPFLSFSNPASSGINVDVAFYDAGLDSRISELSCSLGAASNLLIDPTASTPPAACTVVTGAGAANGNAGLAVITPVSGSGSTQAVVPPAPLTGNFTLANLTLGSAFGENAFGRLAVNGDGSKATAGQNVDGNAVRYQRFTPAVLMVPVYFNPNTLGAPENDGNRVILAEFNDQYGARFDVTPLSDSPTATLFTNVGHQLSSQTLSVTGVLLSNLQEVSGNAAFGSSGKAFFTVNPGGGNAFGIFSQSQGTFASGQRMPAVDAVPTGTPITLSGDVQPIFTSTCATSLACHVTGNVVAPPVNPMDLTAGNAFAQLVNVASSESPLPRVAPGDPNGSFLIHKITGMLDPGEGGVQMPNGGTPLTAAQMQTIIDWVAAGAMNN